MQLRTLFYTLLLFLCSFSYGQKNPTTQNQEEEIVQLDKFIVTSSPHPKTPEDQIHPVSTLSGQILTKKVQSTLGETLSGEPGLSSTYFGPGASRPIIRGMGGSRIRVLTNGLGTIDASTTSPDHAVSIEPALTDRIEIVRGPISLLYGSSAIGGVVNAINEEIPTTPSEKPISGHLETRFDTAANEKTALVDLKGGNQTITWHLNALKRKTDDLEIPGHAELEHEEDEEGHTEEISGILENSSIATEQLSGGISYFWDAGFIGFSYSGFDSLYGIPGHEHHHEEEEDEEHEDESVRIDLQQRRLNLRSEITEPFGIFSGAKINFNQSDYEHIELEGDEIGTRFLNKGYEGRAEILHEKVGLFQGSFGVQVEKSDFEAIGAEAFVPPSDTQKMGVYIYEEAEMDSLTFQFGTRYEHQSIDLTDGSRAKKSFDGINYSSGIVWSPTKGYATSLSIARTQRLPNAQELFSNGPHLATNAFEIGDSSLEKETSTGIDLSFRKSEGFVTGEFNLFLNRIDNYVFEEATGGEMDELNVYQYVAREAEFYGAELKTIFHLYHKEDAYFDLTTQADLVRATDRTTNTFLPRIPPISYRIAFDYGKDGLSMGTNLEHSTRQTNTGAQESTTDSYTLLNAYISYQFSASNMDWTLFLKGTNLTNAEARSHTSFLKNVAPLPGRNFTTGIRYSF
jgi:iron complex outermembrane receptor protein